MTTANITAAIACDANRAMETVMAVEKYHTWRSGVSKTEVAGENQYIEYTKDGYATRLKLTVLKPDSQLEIEMENDHVKGSWTFIFTPKENGSELDISTCVSAKKLSTRPVGQSVFERSYIKQEQEQFLADLKKHLG